MLDAMTLDGHEATWHWKISGQVQGVGFRPFVYRLAQQHQLKGWVKNCMGTVEIKAQGANEHLALFNQQLLSHAPSLADPKIDHCSVDADLSFKTFTILESSSDQSTSIQVPTDLFLCADCLAEMQDVNNRRYAYPFINCTQCGPRYTLIKQMPYDRVNTTMAKFALCDACESEYNDPLDRRFHAEPVACETCGPVLQFRNLEGELLEGNEEALKACIDALKQHQIIAVKGIGGYHIMCDARSDETVKKLRKRKNRPDKPLAVMFPSSSDNPFYALKNDVLLNHQQEDLLISAERPIVIAQKVIAQKQASSHLSKYIAPNINEVGVMLPYSPLHYLLLNELKIPLVATSGNISGEPVLTSKSEVESRLTAIADGFLHHNRDIQRPADDSVYRFVLGKNRPIRLGRGIAPLKIQLPHTLKQPVLAVGGHMKNNIALAWDNQVVISPHIGDMGSARSLDVFMNTVDDLQHMYGVTAQTIICDAHPGYATSRYAHQTGLPIHEVWHHYAHASSAYYETGLKQEPCIAFTWDGVGYGEDGTLWGGEAFLGYPSNWQRVATIRPFNLPGGEAASREPWRSAAALCWQLGVECQQVPKEFELLKTAWQRRLNSPQTSSVGRLFDAVASLTGCCSQASFEGQGPMILEAQCQNSVQPIKCPLNVNEQNSLESDWQPLIEYFLTTSDNVKKQADVMHSSMAQLIVDQSCALREKYKIKQVVLSGGVFQNKVLLERAVALLKQEGFIVSLTEQLPVNDAGLSFGQVIEFLEFKQEG